MALRSSNRKGPRRRASVVRQGDPPPRRVERLTLVDYAGMLWDYKWVIAGAALIALMAAVASSSLGAGPMYEASTRLDFNAIDAVETSTGQGLGPIEVERAISEDIGERTTDELGASEGSDYFSTLDAVPVEGATSLTLSAVGHTPAVKEWLDAYAANYVDYRTELYSQGLNRSIERDLTMLRTTKQRLDEIRKASPGSKRTVREGVVIGLRSQYLSQIESARIELALAEDSVEAAGPSVVEQMKILPALGLRALAAVMVGLLIGGAIAIGLGMTRPRIRRKARAEQLLGSPVLATIPRVRRASAGSTPSPTIPGEHVSARSLRDQLQLFGRGSNGDDGANRVVVTSAGSGEGRSTIAASIADSFALSGRKTLFVAGDEDGDQKGATETMLSDLEPPTPGSSGYDVVSFTRAASINGGVKRESLDELLSDLDATGLSYDAVVVDAPPLLSSSDGLRLACEADAVAVVLRRAVTREDSASRAMELLERYDAPVAGTVLNFARGQRRPVR
ncbi:MAG: hypothetical protein M3124_06780 [Actinomycetota bacterium]|nr:hypothetical protein [Actinomycetota bacterium]